MKQLDASIKGTHPEENHTKAVHDQAKELVSDKKTTPVRPVHDDEEAEMTIYSSGSREDSEEEGSLVVFDILIDSASTTEHILWLWNQD